jgi:DsbC/DsbD-like thiol-disulfide interchange protein
MRRFNLLVTFAVLTCTALSAQAPDTKVSLLSANRAVKPGSSMTVGIHFQIPAGWHTYWMNPGDAGEPAKVQWSLPAGWSAGELQWPAPKQLVNAAGVDYGYEGDVTLLTPLKVGTSGGEITANLRWLVCKDVCVPQKGTAKLSLRVGSEPVVDPDGKQVIEKAMRKLPKSISPQWKINAFQNPTQVMLNFRPGIKVQQAGFFPEQREVIDYSSPQKLSSTSYAAQLAMKRFVTNKKLVRLKGVLVVNGIDAYNVDVPVK